jgi:hypothetical protein
MSQDNALLCEAEGASPADSAPLCCIPVDRAYEVEVDVSLQDAQSEAGLLLFYNPQCYTGIALSPQGLKLIHRTYDQVIVPRAELETAGGRARLRIVNDHHEVDFWYQLGDGDWRKASRFVGSFELSSQCFWRLSQPARRALCCRKRHRAIPRLHLSWSRQQGLNFSYHEFH